MAKKLLAVKFEAADKKRFKGKIGHTRTGACTAKGRCYHGNIPHGKIGTKQK